MIFFSRRSSRFASTKRASASLLKLRDRGRGEKRHANGIGDLSFLKLVVISGEGDAAMSTIRRKLG